MRNFWIPSSIALGMLFQQQLKINIQKSRSYTILLQSVQTQLQQMGYTQSIQQLRQKGPKTILQTHQANLKKQTVSKLSQAQTLKQSNYTLHHLITSAVIGCGLATGIAPGAFTLATGLYILTYEYYFNSQLVKFRYGYELPFQYDFEAVHYLFTIGCVSVLGLGAVRRGLGKVRDMVQTKSLTVKKDGNDR